MSSNTYFDAKISNRNRGAIAGMKLLDVGTGPILHTAFCAAPWFEEITLSDFAHINLEFLQKWKKGEISYMDPVFEYLVENNGAISGVQVLDIGTGPMPHTAFCAAPWFEEITLSDFSQKNLEFLQKWKDGKINHMGPVLEYLVKLEKSSSSVEERQDELRKKIKHIVKCDVTESNPVASTPVDGVVFDAITSSLCLEIACLTLDDYAKSVRNIRNLLKPGGHLVLVGVLEDTFYTVGEYSFKNLPIKKDELQDIWQKEGFEIISLKDFNETISSPKHGNDNSDFKSAFVMVAKKRENTI